MPVSFTISPRRRLGIVRAEDLVRGDDVHRVIWSLVLDPSWEPGFSVVWDCQGIRELLLDTQHYLRMAALGDAYRVKLGPGRTAIVVQRELDHMVAEAFLLLAWDGQRERRLWKNAEEALGWLEPRAGAF